MSEPAIRRSGDRRIRVLVVDDSAVVRGLTRRWLETEAAIEISALCSDGAQALAEAKARQPDIILLDVEMPKMDGLAALPELRKAAPAAHVIMASSLTSKGAATTIRALSLGAADYVAKPEATSLGAAEAYRRELVGKILALGAKNVAAPPAPGGAPQARVQLRPPPSRVAARPAALVIASSTGGPQALQTFLAPIAKRIQAPILIVQHMPATFTTIFAEKLGQHVGKPCREAKDGDRVEANTFLMAPGDYHMRLQAGGMGPVVRLDRGDLVNFCRPAADPLFESASQTYGSRLLGVVLTGMGSDGRNGSGRIVAGGGRVVVQDEASSVVWGMPGAVAMAGHAEAVKPLGELSDLVLRIMNGDAS